MNADLHMADDLKNTGKGNLFVIFGEPDSHILDKNGKSLKRVVDGKTTRTVPKDAKAFRLARFSLFCLIFRRPYTTQIA